VVVDGTQDSMVFLVVTGCLVDSVVLLVVVNSTEDSMVFLVFVGGSVGLVVL